jgi:hypothetical protein
MFQDRQEIVGEHFLQIVFVELGGIGDVFGDFFYFHR